MELVLIQTPRHRAKSLDAQAKIQKLREFVEPVKAQWQEENIKSAVKSYSGFCELLGLDKAQAYLVSRQAHNIKDWGSTELDAEGLALQNELEERLKVRVTPINPILHESMCQHNILAIATPSDENPSCTLCGPSRQVIHRIPGYLCDLGGRICKHSGGFIASFEVRTRFGRYAVVFVLLLISFQLCPRVA